MFNKNIKERLERMENKIDEIGSLISETESILLKSLNDNIKQNEEKETKRKNKRNGKYSLNRLLENKKITKEIYNVDELAKLLEISRNTVSYMIKDKRLKAHKFGKHYYIKKEDLINGKN